MSNSGRRVVSEKVVINPLIPDNRLDRIITILLGEDRRAIGIEAKSKRHPASVVTEWSSKGQFSEDSLKGHLGRRGVSAEQYSEYIKQYLNY
ncbi:hypothetical protein J4234_07035 [Candidatus Woesearchaeota archaeon]|nr:hypothetical protein [Candidatus Woesearchaeota archaeon]